jgi:hypothetical protein
MVSWRRRQTWPRWQLEYAAQASLRRLLRPAQRSSARWQEFDEIHSIHRALSVGSVDQIIPASELRPYLIGAIERGLTRDLCPELSQETR